jgi:nucleotide-binding universal stress UspA family protein
MAYGGNPALGAPAALEVGAQLLVLAGGGTASVLPGTTSQYVLRKAPCPVLIVPGS